MCDCPEQDTSDFKQQRKNYCLATLKSSPQPTWNCMSWVEGDGLARLGLEEEEPEKGLPSVVGVDFVAAGGGKFFRSRGLD